MEVGRLLLWVGLALTLQHHGGAAHKLVCYFTNWAHSRPGPASIRPHDLNPFLCTHLILAFASMNDHRLVAKSTQDEKVLYPEFNKLKERNRGLKTLLSVGGWNFGTSRFTAMLSTPTTRMTFISSAISFLRTHGFDGLDLCFLYPGLRGSPVHDRWNFLFLIQELLSAFQKEAQLTLRPRLLLSAAVSGDPHIIQRAYNVPHLGRLLDFISVLTYDFHGSWEKFTGHNSPLLSLPGDPKSSAHAMNYWRELGAPSEKLLMGFPTYGRTFHLHQASENWLQAEALGPASPGKYTKQPGFLAYYEICSFLRGATKGWIHHQLVPYAYKGEEWLGYDDAASFRHKALHIKKEHFGGAMVWTLDLDDVRGTFCGTGPFPLVCVLHRLLWQAESSSTLSPQFWTSSATNSSRTGPGRLTETEGLTTNSGGPLPGGEGAATETQRKAETVTTLPRGRMVSPTRGTAAFVKLSVVLQGKMETPAEETVTPVEETVTPTEEIVTPAEEIVTPVEETVTPTEEIVTSAEEIVTPVEEIVTPTEEIVTPVEEIVTPVEEIVTPAEEIMTPVAPERKASVNSISLPSPLCLKKENLENSSVDQGT
ncbi:oviduct-specific glycoprotein [Sturnira hondurensis]|uniref:oviduct-specific glycoprotein n=1 Tax=Sturnira hondurensis TaxID=192404 RepID=UPI001879B312|nr:oviduct-specific glycoprotein [Sturnira hondurensis]